jgi:hypothetical protein
MQVGSEILKHLFIVETSFCASNARIILWKIRASRGENSQLEFVLSFRKNLVVSTCLMVKQHFC